MALERMQVLVRADQRRRLEEVARLCHTSVAAVVREAIDEHVGRKRTSEESLAALEWLEALPPIEHMPPDELRDLIDTRFGDDRYDEA
jgi:hypothetical protein